MRTLLRYAGAMCLALGVVLPQGAWSYPAFARLPYVSDAAPFCAGCHASTDAAYHPELPAAASQAQVYTSKHYAALEKGDGAYRLLSAQEREQLLALAKKIDQHASVTLEAPSSAAPGEVITVTVTARGGIGPQVGLMLVDAPLRYQARPIQATGWYIVEAPQVIGPDGQAQTTWLARRYDPRSTNLNFVLVYGVKAEPERDRYPTVKVTYRLRAPQDPGEYTMTAAFLYGTADPDELKTGEYVNPPGGTTAPSGRVQFADVARIRVQ
ncbi:MAG: hypothetical protein KatS3mg131_3425 [Candidatus Tectimicrobiota bacterium]|nr:MAG: hypothetical protein KatS3mg131_3425 [Candidatus Tectomicrobia bacterium]